MADTLRSHPRPGSNSLGAITHTLTGEGFDASEDGTGRGTPIVAFHQTQDPISGDISPALGASSSGMGVMIKPFVKIIRSGARDDEGELPAEVWAERDTAPTMNAMDNTGDSRARVLVGGQTAVRRLTPMECERLQGFPDGWTEGGRSSKLEICANIRGAGETALHGLDSASCTTRGGSVTELRNCHHATNPRASIVIELLSPEDSVIATTSRGSVTVMHFNLNETSPSAEPTRQVMPKTRKVEPTERLWSVTWDESFAKANSSIISTWTREITESLTSISATPTLNICGFITRFSALPPNSSSEDLFDLRMETTSPQSDSARYRQMGNAVAVPCVEWIMRRLVDQ